jgi:hypothetical protein
MDKMNKTNLCIDCRYYTMQPSEKSGVTIHSCERFKQIDPVMGAETYLSCYDLRDCKGVCGPSGEGWTNKLWNGKLFGKEKLDE